MVTKEKFQNYNMRCKSCLKTHNHSNKGKTWKEELVAAEKTWNFSWEAVTSITDSKSVVLKIGELSRAN